MASNALGGRLHVQILRGFLLGIERRIGKQRIGQRLQPCFARNLRSRAALGLVGQVEIFQRLLGRGRLNGAAQYVGEFALLLNRSQNRRAPQLQFTEIQEALFQRAQVRIVQIARGLLAIARDKRHGRSFVKQGDRSRNLRVPHRVPWR